MLGEVQAGETFFPTAAAMKLQASGGGDLLMLQRRWEFGLYLKASATSAKL